MIPDLTAFFQKPLEFLPIRWIDVHLAGNILNRFQKLLGSRIAEHPGQAGIGRKVCSFRRGGENADGSVIEEVRIVEAESCFGSG
jgi:hypothetical protein